MDRKYLEVIKARAKTSRVYKKYQSTGLALAEILEDRSHKAIYMRLAKNHDEQQLMNLAKVIADKKGVRNKGAYFMRLVQTLPKYTKKENNKKKNKKRKPKKKQRTLF